MKSILPITQLQQNADLPRNICGSRVIADSDCELNSNWTVDRILMLIRSRAREVEGHVDLSACMACNEVHCKASRCVYSAPEQESPGP